jgi:ABC-2 type transport system permease protein
VVNLSPFVHLPAVPNLPPDWATVATLSVIGAIMTAIGLAGYARRDLTT